MIRFSLNLLLAICLVFGGAATAFAQTDGMGEHDGPPPMLVIMPPPDIEKPEGIEMSEDPTEAFHQMFDVFFDMMDKDGNGELNHDELDGWVHPSPMIGSVRAMSPPHMDGAPPPMGTMGGEMEEHIRHLEEELRRVHQEQHMRYIEELGHHRDRIMEEIRHMREEQAHLADRLLEMGREEARVAQELQQAQSERPMGDEPPN